MPDQDPSGPLVKQDEQMVCKHCGSGDFYVDVTVSGWQNGDVWVDDSGKPQFQTTGRVEVDTYDSDIEKYVCNACRADSYRLEDLVVSAPIEGDLPIAPCGRCDHSRASHPERGSTLNCKLGWERGPMPCTHEGCDCHDYYDREVAEAGQPAAIP